MENNDLNEYEVVEDEEASGIAMSEPEGEELFGDDMQRSVEYYFVNTFFKLFDSSKLCRHRGSRASVSRSKPHAMLNTTQLRTLEAVWSVHHPTAVTSPRRCRHSLVSC